LVGGLLLLITGAGLVIVSQVMMQRVRGDFDPEGITPFKIIRD
jgi:hypothetical protein|tara:strand:- start:3653 stop:3781 length:129 start_codon:yes stop_codon:yes gene_type:complete